MAGTITGRDNFSIHQRATMTDIVLRNSQIDWNIDP